jgi:hypothetical protein
LISKPVENSPAVTVCAAMSMTTVLAGSSAILARVVAASSETMMGTSPMLMLLSDVDAVVVEDVGEAGGYDCLKAPILDAPRSVLAR